jgi:WD40 repeat protein/serine/threonine protein kinase
VAQDHADRDLLFEAMAIHLGFVTRRSSRKLSAARGAVAGASANAGEPLSFGDRLVEAGLLSASQCGVLDSVVNELLESHAGNLRRCFDELSAFGRLRRDLEARRDPGASGDSHSPSSDNLTVAATPVPETARNDSAPGRDDRADLLAGHSFAGEDDDQPDDDSDGEWFLGTPSASGSRFHVLRPHAQGGIGKVSVAFDAELQREVALKQIKPERADDQDSRSRFKFEAEVTGRLEHPGIVPVYGLGTDGQGRPYYAMRFVRGTSFEEAIKRFHDGDNGRDSRRRTLALRHLLTRFVDVCQTIAYAHSRGVLHRDLKPANVLLGPFNESLVVDWGLAKVFAPDGADGRPVRDQPESSAVSDDSDGTTLSVAPEKDGDDGSAPDRIAPLGFSSSTETAAGTAFGTPAFMSPEQADGRVDQLGPASDVYSLGAMLYTLLAGRAPFEFVWCDVTALLDRVRRGDFPPPRKLKPWVPRPLEAICLKAMASQSRNRYASASELALEIERWLADEPVLAYREPASARVARWGRRNKPIVTGMTALLLTALVALSAGIVLIESAQKETEKQRVIATAKSIEAIEQAQKLKRRDVVSRVNLAYREYLDDNVALADNLLDGCDETLRGWEWEYSRRLGHSELETLAGSPETLGHDVWSIAFAPDGAFLAAGSGPWYQVGDKPTGALVVRSVDRGATRWTVAGLKGAVQAVAFAPDGRHLAAAWGYSGTDTGADLAVFDVKDGARVWTKQERGLNILGLAYAPDGHTLATACGFFNEFDTIGYARIRDAATGEPVNDPIFGGPGGVASVSYSPDGRRLALASRGAVDIHDVANPGAAPVHQLRGHLNFVYTVAFSPDGRHIASAGWDNTIRLWNPNTGALVRTLAGHRGFVRGLAFSPDGSHLISGSEDKSVRRWDLTGGEDNAAFHGHTGFVHCVAFNPAGALVASGSLDGTVKIWPAAAPDSQVNFRNSSGWVGTLAFAPDGLRVASAHNKNIRIWDPRTGEEFARFGSPQDMLGKIGLAFSPDGTTLVTGGARGSVIFWDTVHWTRQREWPGQGSLVVDAAFTQSGSRLATITSAGVLALWDVSAGTPLWNRPAHDKGGNAVAISPDAARVASGGNDYMVRIWDAASGKELNVYKGHKTNVVDVAFAPDRTEVASVGGGYHGPDIAELKVWDYRTCGEVARFEGHTGLVTAVGYFRDGKRIATASDDRTIKLWDSRTGEDVFTLRGHTSGVVSLAISDDGRQIVSGGIDHSAKTWSTQTLTGEGETAADVSFRRAAVEHVHLLFTRHLIKADVLTAIRADQTISPRFRAAALEIAGRRAENAAAMYEAAWLAIIKPTGTPDGYQRAVRLLEAASAVVSDDPERLDSYRRALALAFVRAGQPAKALETLRSLPAASAPTPLDLTVAALANAALGQENIAAEALGRLRVRIQSGKGNSDPQVLEFLHEAEHAVDSISRK